MKKFYTLTVLFILVSLLTPMQGWAYSRAKVTLIPNPVNGGKVCVLNSLGTPTYLTSSVSTQSEKKWYDTNVDYTFYRYAQTNPGYVFKGWSENSGANTGDKSNPSSVIVTGGITKDPTEKTYYAIFAHLAANTTTPQDFGSVTRGESSTKKITINHAHASTVTLTLEGNHKTDFSLSKTSFNSTSEGSEEITITFTPQCGGIRSATLKISSSDNELQAIEIPLSGTGLLHSQTLNWNEPINTRIQVGESPSISATASTGLAVTYSSSNPSVLAVDANTGTLSALAEGTATITASQAGNCTYAATSITKDFTVLNKKTPTFWLQNDANLTSADLYVDKSTTVNVANSADGFTAVSSDNNIVSCSQLVDGVVTLTANNAGTATITFTQPETSNVFSASCTFPINVAKRTLSATINQTSAGWAETISNPFTVKDNFGESISNYTVVAQNPLIADYDNGQIVTLGTNGTARFKVSYDGNYKYDSFTETFALEVKGAAVNTDCRIILQDSEEHTNTFGFSPKACEMTYNIGADEVADSLYVDIRKGKGASGPSITITGYDQIDAAGNSYSLLSKGDDLNTSYTTEKFVLNSNIKSVKIVAYSSTLCAFFKNVVIIRKRCFNVTPSEITLIRGVDNEATDNISVEYGLCETTTFNAYSNSSNLLLSPASFTTPTKCGQQSFSVTTNASINGKEEADVTIYDASRSATVHVTCYQQYTVTFNPGEGAMVGTTQKDVTYEHAYGELPTPSKTGYTFDGWYTEAEGGSQVMSETVCRATDAHTLYAHWTANTYQVTFNPGDGASVSPAQQSVIFDNAYDNLPTPTKTGYTFAGWYTAATGGSQVTSETVCKTADAHTLYAHWTANTYDLTLNYNFDEAPNNGVFYSQANYFTYDVAYEITETPNANPTGYHFVGWFANADGTGDQWTSGTYQTAGNTALYAKWTINTYDLTFVLNDGSWVGTAPADNKITLTYGQTYGDQLASEKIQRSGYTFQGWFSDANFATDSKVKATDVVLTPPTTLYAKWLINALTATFDANYPNGRQGAAYSFSSSVRIGETYTLPETNPSIDGYAFAGWRTETNIMVDASTFCQIGKNHTLYGCWTANSYEVSYDPNQGNWSGNGQPTKVNLTYDQTYGQDSKFPAAPTRDGYTFQGWWTAADGGQQVTDETIMETAAAHTLYAHWSSNQYKLIFDYKDEAGTTVPVGVTFDANYPAVSAYPTQPVRTGFSFVGWYNAANEPIDLYELPNKKYTTVGNERLFAHWNPLHFTVQFKTSAESEPIDTMSISVAYHDVYGILPNLKENGAEVTTSWYDAPANGMLVTSATIFQPEDINQDFVLYAATSPRKFALQLVDGNETTTIGITKGQTYAAALAAAGIDKTETGKTFLGWSDTQNGNLKNLEDGFDETCQTLYARWKTQTIEVRFVDAEHSAANYGVMSVPYGETYGNGVRPNATQTGLPVVAEVDGKTFDGWSTESDNALIVTNTTLADLNVATLYAHFTAKNYIIYLHENLGVDKVSTMPVTFGADYSIEALANVAGYDFAGWYEQNAEAPYATSGRYAVADDLHLYARWDAVKGIDVAFALNDGTANAYDSKSLTYGGNYSLPETAPTREGYTFVGWFTAATNGTEVTAQTVCNRTAAHTLYAHWTANNYTIYLHENNGVDKTTTLDVTYGQTYTLSALADMTGYTFAGWFTQEAGGDNYDLTPRTYTLTSALHLYAHWTAASDIAVSLDAQGGSDVSGITATYGQAYQNLPANANREGYTFVGWFTAAENGTEVTNATICKQAANHTLYAHWKANNYTIYLHENNGVDKTTTLDVTYGQTYTLSALADMMGYTFDGWFTAAEGGKKYESTTYSYISNEDLDLYAHWTAVNYMVTFSVPENATLETTSKEVTFDSQYGELPTPALEGYVFSGWFNANGNIVTSTDVCRTPSNHTLTAHWSANTYTITFDANGGECHTANKQVAYNTAIGKLPLATRDGYTFNGWWASDASEATTEKDIFAGLENLTLKAHWEACQYTVSFLPEGGTTTADNKQVTYQAQYGDLPTATRDGYKFDGWFTCDNEPIMSDTKYTNIGNQELHAHWTAEKYKVTFSIPDKATLSTPFMEVTFDSPYGELPTPTLAGYVFTGWYTTQYDGSLVSHSTIVSTAQAHTLYARWTEADITIQFDSNGGSKVADQTRKYSGLYCEPALPIPTREGYTLIGWYFEDGTLVTSTTKVDRTEAHTLTAYWAQAGVPYLVLGDNWKISSPEADNDYRFKTADGKNYSLSNIRVDDETSFEDGGTGTTVYQASVTIFLNGVFYGVGVEQGQTKVLQTTENGNSCLFTANSSERATIQSAEMNKRWFNFDLYEESTGTWRLSISCGKLGNPTEVDNNESEQPARAKKYIEDGKVFIQTQEDRIYNASGQLVK